MILKAYLNQYGLMIYEFDSSYIIMFNGLYLKLKSKRVNLREFDSVKFYELHNNNF